MVKFVASLAFVFIVSISFAQKPTVEVLTNGTNTILRGLSVVNENIIWVCGSNGTIGKSSNAGKNWKWVVVKGFEKTEFRDIEAFDGNTALIMSSGEASAYILKTVDGGDSWKVVYENKTPGMFLDAMDFANNRFGIVVGDPVNGKVFLARTTDTGNTWEVDHHAPAAENGEAFFAASGSNIRLFANGKYLAVSGGTRSRLITNSSTTDLPIIHGKETTGAYSIDVFDDGVPSNPGQRMIVVGGDYTNDTSTNRNCAYTTNGGKKWKTPTIPPHGYRSCVEFLSKKDILACGPNGVDFSDNEGKTWELISKEGFNVCRIARIGPVIFLAGNNGKVGRVVWRKEL